MSKKQRQSLKSNKKALLNISNTTNKTTSKKDLRIEINVLKNAIDYRTEVKTIKKHKSFYEFKLNSVLNSIAQLNLLDMDKNVLSKLKVLRNEKQLIKFNLLLLDKHELKLSNLKYWITNFNKTILEKECRSFWDFTKTNKELFYSNIKTFHKDYVNKTEILNNPKNLYVIYNNNKKIVEFFNLNRFVNIQRKRVKTKISIIKKVINKLLFVEYGLSF